MGKTEGYVFTALGIFLAGVSVIYWFSSHDWTGTTCLVLSAGLAALIAFYLVFTARRMGPRPEDRPEAEVAEGAGDLAHFSPGSPWPIGVAGSAALGLLGFIFGLWITFIAIALVLFTLTGLLFEHFRGVNLHTEDEVGVDPVGMGGGHG